MKQIENLESRRLMADISVVAAGNTVPTSFVAGDKIKPIAASYTVAATGDLSKEQGKAKLVLNVALRPAAGGADIAVGSAKITASGLAKKPATAKVTFSKLKVAPAAGSYSIVATLSGQSAAGDANAANDSATTAVTVTAGTSNPGTGTGPFAAIGIGSVLTFKKTGKEVDIGGNGFQDGIITDENGKKFYYHLVVSNPTSAGVGVLAGPKSTDAPLASLIVSVNSGSPRWGGKTYTFGGTEAGSKGYVLFMSKTIYFT